MFFWEQTRIYSVLHQSHDRHSLRFTTAGNEIFHNYRPSYRLHGWTISGKFKRKFIPDVFPSLSLCPTPTLRTLAYQQNLLYQTFFLRKEIFFSSDKNYIHIIFHLFMLFLISLRSFSFFFFPLIPITKYLPLKNVKELKNPLRTDIVSEEKFIAKLVVSRRIQTKKSKFENVFPVKLRVFVRIF